MGFSRQIPEASNDQHVSTPLEATKSLCMNSKICSPVEINVVVSLQASDTARAGDLAKSRHDDAPRPNTSLQSCSGDEESVIGLSRDLSKSLIVNPGATNRTNRTMTRSSQKTAAEAILLISTGARTLDDILDEWRNIQDNSSNGDDDSCDDCSIDSLQYYKMRARRNSKQLSRSANLI